MYKLLLRFEIKSAGFSLIEMLIVTAIMTVTAAGMAQLFQWSGDSQSNLRFRGDADVLQEEIRAILSDPTACVQTLGTLPLASPTETPVNVSAIKDSTGAVVYQAGVPIADVQISLVSATLGSHIYDTSPNGRAILTLNFEHTRQSNGPRSVSRRINIGTRAAAGPTVQTCVGLAKMSDGIWQRTPANLNNIAFNGGLVGIGQNPTEALDVNGNIRGAGTLSVASAIQGGGDLNVSGNAQVNGNLKVIGQLIGAFSCRTVVNQGPAPNYVSRAECGNDEFLLSGGGSCEIPGNNLCAAITKGFMHHNAPQGNAWVVDCVDTNYLSDACSEAYAICCKKN